MKLTRTLDQLGRETERYIGRAKAGRRDRLLAARCFDLCDALDSADSDRMKAIAKRIATETETLIRLAHTADSKGFYAAWSNQRESIAQARAIIAQERTA